MIEITQNLFVCGTPRRRGNSCGGSAYQYRHYTHHPDLESAASLCQSQSQHHFQWNPNVLLMEDEQEEGECAGIEIDTENSLKAAYELYRV